MPRLREEFDADRADRPIASQYRSETNRYEVPCSICERVLFVDEATKLEFERAMEHDLDNRFVCFECEQEADRLAYE